MKNNMKILHVDGDAFFASIERAEYPSLRNKPVVVGLERGIATAMTYEAKALGIRRGMPIFEIKRNYPNVTVLPTHFELYEMYSKKLHNILENFSDKVEAYSIDECFALLDERTALRFGGYESFLSYIKYEIQKILGITYSFGLANTKVLAKLASKTNKPDGKTIIDNENRKMYLEKTKIESVWGIGTQTANKLKFFGINTALDFANKDILFIKNKFPKPIHILWYELNGVGLLGVDSQIKTISKSLQSTKSFLPVLSDKGLILSELSNNIENVFNRLRREKQVANKAYIFLKQADFKKIGAEVIFDYGTNDPSRVFDRIKITFDKLFKDYIKYRTTGIILYDLVLEETLQIGLFDSKENKQSENSYIQVMDQIKSRFGSKSIFLSSSLRSINRREEDYNLSHKGDNYIENLPFPFLGEVN